VHIRKEGRGEGEKARKTRGVKKNSDLAHQPLAGVYIRIPQRATSRTPSSAIKLPISNN